MTHQLLGTDLMFLATVYAGTRDEKAAVLIDRPNTRNSLKSEGLIDYDGGSKSPDAVVLTDKGRVLLSAMLALPMPVEQIAWRMPT